jgi:Cytochrome P460
MKAYRAETLPCPDGAILARSHGKHVSSAQFAPAFVPEAATRVQIMVRDSKKYVAAGGWEFGRGRPVDEEQHKTCIPCHEANVKGHDLVFTRYAP